MSIKDRFVNMKVKTIQKELEKHQEEIVQQNQEEMFKKIDKVGEDFKKAIDQEVRDICIEILKEKGLINDDS